MKPARCLELRTPERALAEMKKIGVDPAGASIMEPKQFHFNIRVEGLTPVQANILKQDILSIGGEAAVARGVASCSVKSTDAVISGTRKQLRLLVEKLMFQSMGLPEVAGSIEAALGNYEKRDYVLRGRNREWVMDRTFIMGILNVTPDSFSDGGRFFGRERAVERALEMAEEGADWIDVGGESTRPGAEPIAAEEEMKRVVPVVEALSGRGFAISVDTSKAAVAKAALEAGAEIVNDVTAMTGDEEMASVCARYGAPVVLMHMRGTPRTMQADTGYQDLVSEVYGYLAERMDYAIASGIGMDRIMIDPGIGFGKSREGNLELISRLGEFKSLGAPVLLGPSRKSFIGATLGNGVEDKAIGTLSACVAAALNGARILRVHDVKEAKKACLMADAIKSVESVRMD